MRVQLRDFEMEFDERGAGIPFILIHGYPLNHKMWEPQLEGLSDIARVITPDLRGHGQSESVSGINTIDDMAKDIKELLENLDIKEPVILGGFSMGGYISFAFYRNYPELVKGMILAATRATADNIDTKVSREEAAAIALERGAEAIVEMQLPKMLAPVTQETRPEIVELARRIMLETSVQAIVGDLRGMLNRQDSTSTLKTIDCPVLILHGADDQLIPSEEVDLMKTEIRNSQFKTIPNAGHLLNLEQPQEFNQAVREFIKSIRRTDEQIRNPS
jgi:3-oxoadipate enol-lactonase